MFKKGFKWYNNGILEGMYNECPEGWVQGRLTPSKETKIKQSLNSGVRKMSDERRKEINEKIRETKRNKTQEEKDLIKIKTSLYWTEEKRQLASLKAKEIFSNIDDKKRKERGSKISSKLKDNEERKENISNYFSNLSEEERSKRSSTMSTTMTNYWQSLNGEEKENKIKKANNGAKEYLDRCREDKNLEKERLSKIYYTHRQNNSFNLSKPEEDFYNKLKELNLEVIRQYKSELYPFACDFYIPALNLYIELNYSWTHGYVPYIKTNPICCSQLKDWEEKAKTSQYYKNAIYTWTTLDVAKRKYLEDNKLNYKILYNKKDEEEFFNWITSIMKA